MLLKEVVESGGGTINRNLLEVQFKSGFQVSIRDIASKKVEDTTEDNFHAMLEVMRGHLDDGEYIGVWVNKGRVHIDKSIWVETFREARRIGRERNQTAVYDWAKKESIYL